MFRKVAAIVSLSLVFLGALSRAADTDIPEPRRLFGLGDVRLIAMSSDLRFMATAGQGGSFLWDIETSSLLHRLEGDWRTSALAFSPDGKVLFTADIRTIRAWDTETGALIRNYIGHNGEIGRLQITPDGKNLVSASADNTVRVWEIETGFQIHSVSTPGSPVIEVAISPDGQKLATVDTFLTNCVKIWDIATESQIAALPKTNWNAQLCLFTPAGHLVTTAADRSVTLWNIETTEVVRSFAGITNVTDIVHSLWMPNATTIAAVCNSGVFLWNLDSGQLTRVVFGDPVFMAAGVPNDFLVAGINLDYNVRIRQLPGGDALRTFQGHTTSSHSAVAFSPDGRYVLSAGTESSTRLWNRQTGQQVREFIGSPAGTATATFSADGSRILTTVGLPEPGARLWKIETGEIERDFRWNGFWPTSAALSKDGTRVAAAAQDERTRIFDAATGALIHTLVDPGWINHIAFSPTAPLLASGSTDFSAAVYNHQTGQRLHEFFENAGPITAVTFSPNGDTLLIAWQDGLIHLYNSLTFELRGEFFVPAGFLDAAAFSPDGQYILTGESFPGFNATIWDSKTAQSLRTFPDHKWVASAVAFSADGTSILTGAEYVREFSIADLAARLSITALPGQIHLTWSAGQLQHATDPAGPWETLTNALSPFNISAQTPAELYRAQVVTLE